MDALGIINKERSYAKNGYIANIIKQGYGSSYSPASVLSAIYTAKTCDEKIVWRALEAQGKKD